MTTGMTLTVLGERRTRLRAELKELNEAIETVVKAALEQGRPEAAVAREAQVDRMTVRKWAGKR